MDSSRRRPVVIEAPLPYLPSPPIVPEGPSPRSDRAAMMTRHTAPAPPASDADILRELRAAFPESSLAIRVAALNMIHRSRRD